MKINDTFKLRVFIENAENVYGLSTIIRYDPSLVEPVMPNDQITVADGGFLSSDGVALNLLASLKDGTPGDIVLGCSRTGNVIGISGDGAVCLIDFVAKAPGDTQITIVEQETHLLNPDTEDMPFEVAGVGTVIQETVIARISLQIQEDA